MCESPPASCPIGSYGPSFDKLYFRADVVTRPVIRALSAAANEAVRTWAAAVAMRFGDSKEGTCNQARPSAVSRLAEGIAGRLS